MIVMPAPHVDSLWSRYRKRRTIKNRNALVEFYYPLVGATVRRYYRKHASYAGDDRLNASISYASSGLIIAVEKYRTGKGTGFETWAIQKMIFSVIDGIRQESGRLGSTRFRVGHFTASLDADNFEETPLEDRIESKQESVISVLHVDVVLQEFIKTLRGRHKIIFNEIILGSRALFETGKDIGLSDSRVSQIATLLRKRFRDHWDRFN